jgi:hypothetical protein
MLRRLPTIAAVVLALAVGIALGAGPLAGKAEDALFASSTEHQPSAAAGDGFGDAAAHQVGTRLYADRLSGQPVALLALPGADPDTVKALGAEVVRAGGAPPTVWTAGPSLTSSGNMTLVDTLGSQLLDQLGKRAADPAAPAYERMGQLIGSAIASRRSGGEPGGADVQPIRQSLSAAKLVSGHTDSTRLAPVVLVVLGHDTDDRIVSGLLTGLHSRTRGLVVSAGERRGDLTAAASVAAVTTVDGVDRPLGRLAAVLAAIRSLDTPGGSFGASGADGALPLR